MLLQVVSRQIFKSSYEQKLNMLALNNGCMLAFQSYCPYLEDWFAVYSTCCCVFNEYVLNIELWPGKKKGSIEYFIAARPTRPAPAAKTEGCSMEKNGLEDIRP